MQIFDPAENARPSETVQDGLCIRNAPIRKGYLIPLRSKAEIDTSIQTIEAYIADVPPKAANSVLQCVEKVAYSIRD